MIAAVLTAYKPDAGFAKRVAPLLSACDAIVVSDNTPGGCTTFDLPPRCTVIHNGQNIGLGPALNAGIDEARRQGARHIVLFDQDSTPSPSLVCDLILRLEAATAVHGPRCCIGPTHVDDQGGLDRPSGASLAPVAAAQGGTGWDHVSCLPTSGMAFGLDALRGEDRFAEDLFLDLVDFEWCWRLGRADWHFLRAPDLRMFHRLGEAERRFAGLTFHVPAPYRHYFQVRDTLRLACRDYVPTYSKLRLLGVLPLKALVYPFMLDQGLQRLGWMLRGVLDGVRGIQGVGAAAARLCR